VRPAPRSRTTRTSASAIARFIAASKAVISSGTIVFSRSGRLSVSVATPAWLS
jgi:hypothetical protein